MMSSGNKQSQAGGWRRLNGAVYSGEQYFMESMVYSPDDRYGLTISFLDQLLSFRVIEMATGEMKYFKFRTEILSAYEEPMGYYFVNNRDFVLVTHDFDKGRYNQKMYRIYTKEEEIKKLRSPVVTPARTGEDTEGRNGFSPVEIQGRRFLALPSGDGLVLTAWNPLTVDDCNKQEKTIYLSFDMTILCADGYIFDGSLYHCFGSKIFFKMYKETSMFVMDENGEDEPIVGEYFDRFLVLDLADLDFSKREIYLKQDSANLSIVQLKQSSPGSFYGEKEYIWSQHGKYLVAVEETKFTMFAYKRPAVKKNVYVIDLENMTTSIVPVGLRRDCFPSVYNGCLLIWRNRLPIERRGKIRMPRLEYNIYKSTENIYEFKIIRIPQSPISLYSLAKSCLMLGRNGVKLPEFYINRFYEC